MDSLFSSLSKNVVLNALADRFKRVLSGLRKSEVAADINQVNVYGFSALHDAAFRGDLATVVQLLDAGADVNACDLEGNTPLHSAAHAPSRPNATAVCRVLVERGANVHAKNDLWATPLHNAARKGRIDVCEILLDAGADPNASQMVGTSEFPEDTDNLNTFTALHVAAGRRHLEACKLLVARGASASWMRPENCYRGYLTPFQHVIKNGPIEIMHFFIDECGEDAGQCTFGGQTMLEIAPEGSAQKSYLLSLKTESVISDSIGDFSEVMSDMPVKRARDMGPL